MDLDRHDFQLDELIERIKAHDHRLVALQVPEGLKMQALEMMDSRWAKQVGSRAERLRDRIKALA